MVAEPGARKHTCGLKETLPWGFWCHPRAPHWGGIGSIPQLFFEVVGQENSNAKVVMVPDQRGTQMLACPAHPVSELYCGAEIHRKGNPR